MSFEAAEVRSDSVDSLSILCVIPTHGRDVMLAEAIASAQAQTLCPARIVVVDDLGRQETRNKVSEIAETSRIPLSYVDLAGGTGAGASASRNAGARGAEEDFIAFLDDDDLWETRFLSQAVSVLRADTSVSMVVSWTVMARGNYRGQGLRLLESVPVENALGRNPGLTGSNFVIRSNAFDSMNGFDETLHVANDKDFFIRFLDFGLMYKVVAEELVVQRAHDEGQLTSRTERRALGLEKFQAKYASRMTQSDRREMSRVIHGIRRHTSTSKVRSGYHLLAQVMADNPTRVMKSILSRVLGRPTMYK